MYHTFKHQKLISYYKYNIFFNIILLLLLFLFAIITTSKTSAFAIKSPLIQSSNSIYNNNINNNNNNYIFKSTATTSTTDNTNNMASVDIENDNNDNDNDNNNNEIKLPIDILCNAANAYASANGLQVETLVMNDESKITTSYYSCAPISLLPNSFPLIEFNNAKNLMPYYNILVDRISRNSDFIINILGNSISDNDEYTSKLVSLYKDIYTTTTTTTTTSNGNDNNQKPNFALEADYLGIFRSDYMLSNDSTTNNYKIKQIELNTIASSFACLSNKVTKLHQFLLKRYKDEVPELKQYIDNNVRLIGSSNTENKDGSSYGIPDNPTLESIPNSINIAIEHYINRYNTVNNNNDLNKDNILIIFVVQENERNTVDQRMLEYELYNKHNISCLRLSLKQIQNYIKFDNENGKLTINLTKFYNNNNNNQNNDVSDTTTTTNDIIKEIPLIYYRAGYAPTDYPDGYEGIEWLAREKLERSRSIKCPSLGYHLAGTKKIQQILSKPNILELFFPITKEDCNEDNIHYYSIDNINIIKQLRESFAGLYSLDNNDINIDDINAIKNILNNENGKELYVLKPQREGGGYNFYGINLYNKLINNIQKINNKDDNDYNIKLNNELSEYILMERLFPPKQLSILLRNGKVEQSNNNYTISELGCYGCIITSYNGKNIIHNEYSGYLLRTKFNNVDEGGVASGFATLSSPYLC